MQSAFTGDRILQDRADVFDSSILLRGNFAERSTIVQRMIDRQCFIENPRRHAIRVRDVRNAHPRSDDFILVQAPVERATNCSNREQTRDDDDQNKRAHQQPLFPPEALHG